MPMPKDRKNERGIALVLALLLTLMMSVLAASLLFLSQTETYASMNYRMVSQARYGAESGVHKAVNFLLYDYDAPGGPGDPGGLLTDYDTTKSPVVDTVSGDAIVLSANSAVPSNYPNEAERDAFEQAAQGTLAAGNGTVQYAATATLMSMQVVNGQTFTSWEISADGTIGGARPATVTVTSVLEKQLTPGPGTLYAAFATAGTCGALTWGINASTDSYDSTQLVLGQPVTDPNNGDLGTNGNANFSNSVINGSLSTAKIDGLGNCSDGFAATGSGAVNGGYLPLPPAFIVPTPPVPDPAPDPNQNISVDAVPCPGVVIDCTTNPDGSKTFAPGNYGNIALDSTAHLHLTAGTYNINSLNGVYSAQITIDSSPVIINIVGAPPLDAFPQGPVSLFSTVVGDPAKPYNPTQLLINYAGTGAITIANSRFVGQINAPNASLLISTDYYGSLIGSTVKFTNRTSLHFDRSLSAAATFEVGPNMLTSFSWKKY